LSAAVFTANGVSMTFDATDEARIAEHLHRLGIVASGFFIEARREIGEYFLSQVQGNFDHQTLFDGTPMPQSKAAMKRQGKTLIKTHRLYDSYVQQLEGADSVAVGTNSPYGRIHHEGGETGGMGHRFHMQARPVMGMTPRMERRIGDFLIESIRGTQ
jgi:phage virion morphogenesis protein